MSRTTEPELPLLATPAQACQWLRDHVRGTLRVDSRHVRSGDGFLAVQGARTDGRRYLPDAWRSGVGACLVEALGWDDIAPSLDAREKAPPMAQYEGLRWALGPIASAWWHEPSHALKVLAVTGTNGKTSTAWWISQAWAWLGCEHSRPAGVIGTLGSGLMRCDAEAGVAPSDWQDAELTTPDAMGLHASLRRVLDAGASVCAIEASSIGLDEQRLEATRIDTAVLTNFSQDHLDYHGDMATYWRAKRRLFDWPGLRAAVLNVDDAKGAELAAELDARGDIACWTTSCQRPARLRATHIRLGGEGLECTVHEGGESSAVRTRLVGSYNVANVLGVIGALRAQGVALDRAAQACQQLRPVPGRMEFVQMAGMPWIAVDYAHTPDALATVLRAARQMAQERQGRLWCVFGCGGNRDASKRPVMGAVARQWADELVVTSDNPRDERPEVIISQILAGLGADRQAQVEPDRQRAIDAAVERAAAQDVIVIAGKGHEKTQEIAGVKHPFVDLVVARSALARRSAAGVDIAAASPTAQAARTGACP